MAGDSHYKIRGEDETEVRDSDAIERILRGLGLKPAWRYQKYRTEFELERLHVCLDETPLGLLRRARKANRKRSTGSPRRSVSPARDYISDSYRGLEEKRAAATGREPGDLICGEGAAE